MNKNADPVRDKYNSATYHVTTVVAYSNVPWRKHQYTFPSFDELQEFIDSLYCGEIFAEKVVEIQMEVKS